VLATTLHTLGAPVRFGELSPSYDAEVARWAITNAHLMRDRFTVADLSDLLGLGGPQGTEAVLSDLDKLGAVR
jgi:glycerol-1-phosphate dehydrogenase [NAD(P)+]